MTEQLGEFIYFFFSLAFKNRVKKSKHMEFFYWEFDRFSSKFNKESDFHPVPHSLNPLASTLSIA